MLSGVFCTTKGSPVKIHFLNVDLEIESYQNLQPIVDDFGDNVLILYCGEAHGHYRATFELANRDADADSIISHFCLLIESLGKEAKTLWGKAFIRVFDVGYESGLEPRSYSSEIRAETVERVAAIGASIRVTIYPPCEAGNREIS